jgi:uncharacterized membrane protein
MFGLLRFRPTFSLRGRTWLGLRGWDGIPLHPHTVHFPIAAYLIAAAFDVVSLVGRGRPWSREAFVAATWVMVAGAGLSLSTALTGFLEWRFTPRGTQVRRTANAHAVTMVTVTVLILVCIALRLQHWPGATSTTVPITALSVLAAVLVGIGAALGGDLVYAHGVRVDNAGDSFSFHPSPVDLLPDGRPVGDGVGRDGARRQERAASRPVSRT